MTGPLCRDCGQLLDTTTAIDGLCAPTDTTPGCNDLGPEIRWWLARFASKDTKAAIRAQRLARAATHALTGTR